MGIKKTACVSNVFADIHTSAAYNSILPKNQQLSNEEIEAIFHEIMFPKGNKAGLVTVASKIDEIYWKQLVPVENQQLSNEEMQAIFHKIMFPKGNEAGLVAVASKIDGIYREQLVPVEEWIRDIPPVNGYISFNTFRADLIHPTRAIEAVRHLNALFVDIDCYKYAIPITDVLSEIAFQVKHERIFEPTMINFTGRGLCVIWKIEDVPGRFQRTRNLYNHIQTYIYELFKDLGADRQAKDISHVFRIPGTINSKTGETVRFLQVNEENVYAMRAFQQFVDPFEEYKDYKPGRKKKSVKRGEVKRIPVRNNYTMDASRCADLEWLCKMRSYDMTGYKNFMLHIYGYFYCKAHGLEGDVLGAVQALNERFTEPYKTSEVKSIVRSVQAAYKAHLQNPAKGYNYKHESIIDLLDISEEEQKEMRVLITPGEKKARKNEQRRQARRQENGMTKRQADKAYLVKQVKELKEGGMKQKDIAEKLGITKGRVSQIVKALKNA